MTKNGDEAAKSAMRETLKELTTGLGLRRPNLPKALGVGFRRMWNIDSDAREDVLTRVAAKFEEVIEELPADGQYSAEQMRIIARVAYNIADCSELWERNLTKRQEWLDQLPNTETNRGQHVPYGSQKNKMREKIIPLLVARFLKEWRRRFGDDPYPVDDVVQEASQPTHPRTPVGRYSIRWLRLRRLYVALNAILLVEIVNFYVGGSGVPSMESPESQFVKYEKTVTSGPLTVNAGWPSGDSCDSATAVAMQPGRKSLSDFLKPDARSRHDDFRRLVADNDGGGSWGIGTLTMVITSTSDTPALILGLKPRRERIAGPEWIFEPEPGGCGGATYREFELNLDKMSINDLGVVEGSDQTADGMRPRTETFGLNFTVSKNDPAYVIVTVDSCEGNYQWWLDVRYAHDGKVGVLTLGPYRSMGQADKATLYGSEYPAMDANGNYLPVGSVTGPSSYRSCAR